MVYKILAVLLTAGLVWIVGTVINFGMLAMPTTGQWFVLGVALGFGLAATMALLRPRWFTADCRQQETGER